MMSPAINHASKDTSKEALCKTLQKTHTMLNTDPFMKTNKTPKKPSTISLASYSLPRLINNHEASLKKHPREALFIAWQKSSARPTKRL
jgi:hypothetical protein